MTKMDIMLAKTAIVLLIVSICFAVILPMMISVGTILSIGLTTCAVMLAAFISIVTYLCKKY